MRIRTGLVAAIAFAAFAPLVAPTAVAAPAPPPAADTPAHRYSEVAAADVSNSQRLTRSQVLTRARSWVDVNVKYTQYATHTNQYGTYRKDCSGFISMAWGLTPGGMSSPTTWTLPEYSTWLGSLDDLRPGDAINRTSSHIVLFVSWADAAHTVANVYEETSYTDAAGPEPGTIVSRYSRSKLLSEGYRPMRYRNIVEDAVSTGHGPTYHQVRDAAGDWTGFAPLNGYGTELPAGAKDVAVSGQPDGSAQVVIVGADDQVYHRVRNTTGSWTGFAPLNGYGTSTPAKGSRVAIAGLPDGSAQVVIIGADGKVYHRVRSANGEWTGFAPLNGHGTSTPAGAKDVAVSGQPDGSAQVLIVGMDDQLYHRVRNASGSWSEFRTLNGYGTSTPAKGSRVAIAGLPDGSAQVVITGADGKVYHRTRKVDTEWTEFAPLNGHGTSTPAGAKDVTVSGQPDGSAQVVIVGMDDQLYHRVRNASGSWSEFKTLNGMDTTTPAKGSGVAIAGLPDGSAHVVIIGR